MTSTNGDTLKAAPAQETEFHMDSGSDSPTRTAPAPKSTAPPTGGLITVQPLRRSEMQPSYAQVCRGMEVSVPVTQ